MPAATPTPAPAPTTARPSGADLRAAAGLRADGAPWDAVALALGRTAETVRAWPATYGPIWDTMFRSRVAEGRLEAVCAANAALVRVHG